VSEEKNEKFEKDTAGTLNGPDGKSSKTPSKGSANKRIFGIFFTAILLLSGTLFSTQPVQSLLHVNDASNERTIDLEGFAWDITKNPVITVLIIPNPDLPGWRNDYVEDVKQAFKDWTICTAIFTAEHGYTYLNKIRFDIHVAEANDTANGNYNITVKWVARIDSRGAAGGTVVLSNPNGEITKVSITIPITVDKNGQIITLADDDVRNIMADEIGHSLGLGHSNYPEDADYGFYDIPSKVICHSSLDLIGLATVYEYLGQGEFQPPAKSTVSLQGTGITYHYMRNGM